MNSDCCAAERSRWIWIHRPRQCRDKDRFDVHTVQHCDQKGCALWRRGVSTLVCRPVRALRRKDFLSAAINVVHCYAVVKHVISLTFSINHQATFSVTPAIDCVGCGKKNCVMQSSPTISEGISDACQDPRSMTAAWVFKLISRLSGIHMTAYCQDKTLST